MSSNRIWKTVSCLLSTAGNCNSISSRRRPSTRMICLLNLLFRWQRFRKWSNYPTLSARHTTQQQTRPWKPRWQLGSWVYRPTWNTAANLARMEVLPRPLPGYSISSTTLCKSCFIVIATLIPLAASAQQPQTRSYIFLNRCSTTARTDISTMYSASLWHSHRQSTCATHALQRIRTTACQRKLILAKACGYSKMQTAQCFCKSTLTGFCIDS